MIRHGIDDIQKQYFSDASLSHVLAISGMHANYVIIGVGFVLKKFDNRKSKYIFIAFLMFFSQFTGASPSILRAVIMSCLLIIAKLVYRKSDTLNNIAISCIIILILNPYNILNLGFQLSYLGTLGIVIFYKSLEDILNSINIFKTDKKILKKLDKILLIIYAKIKSIIAVSVSANILIFPVLIYSFNNISFTFLISNILVTPILGFMMFLGYLTCIISLFSINLAEIIAVLFNFSLMIFEKIAIFSASISISRFIVVTPSFYVIILIYVCIFYLKFFYKRNHIRILRKIFIILIIIIIVFKSFHSYNLSFKMHFIDVGQGDSTLIVTPTSKTILIDGGGSETGNYNVGESVLVPYLLDRKIKNIDYIIISHFDSDHVQGLFTIMEKLKVKNVVISKQGKVSENYNYFKEIVKRKNMNVIIVKAGDKLIIDKYTYFDILWPTDELVNENILNNNSMVCKLNYKETKILFTGDIEEIAEKKMLELYNNELKADILKVAHHGSKTSSIQEFIDKVNPKIVLIGAGENNKFGHPNVDVLNRFEKLNIEIYRTDKMGEIYVWIDRKKEICVKTMLNEK